MTKRETSILIRNLLQARLTEALGCLKPEHRSDLVLTVSATHLLEWLNELDRADAEAPKLARLQEAELMLAEFLLLVSKPGLYDQVSLEDLQKRAGKLLKEMRA